MPNPRRSSSSTFDEQGRSSSPTATLLGQPLMRRAVAFDDDKVGFKAAGDRAKGSTALDNYGIETGANCCQDPRHESFFASRLRVRCQCGGRLQSLDSKE